VCLRHELDHESTSIYLLSLTAQDRGPDSLPAHASLVVRVDDVNDNAPQISINTLTSLTYAEVRENADVGTFVAHLSVTDADHGENGRFLCAVDDGNFSLQHIYASELKVGFKNLIIKIIITEHLILRPKMQANSKAHTFLFAHNFLH